MTTDQNLTDEQLDVISRVEKLMRLAARNPNKNEADAAAAKAQELLAAYNLEQIEINPDEEKSAVRERLKVRGGMFEYQRELWDAVAALNFCLHWVIAHHVYREYNRRDPDGTRWVQRYNGREFRHHLVGRVVNTRSTRVMCEYLEQTIERLTQERFPANTQRFSREATSYREGIADQIVLRLQERRRDMEAAARRKAAEAARSGVSVAQGLTIRAHSDAEHDANMDEVMGAGWSQKQRDDRRARAEARKAADDAYTAWAEANPEEAAKEAERARKEERRRSGRATGRARYRQPSAREQRTWNTQYAQGYDRGREVSLDQQTGGSSRDTRRLTHD